MAIEPNIKQLLTIQTWSAVQVEAYITEDTITLSCQKAILIIIHWPMSKGKPVKGNTYACSEGDHGSTAPPLCTVMH